MSALSKPKKAITSVFGDLDDSDRSLIRTAIAIYVMSVLSLMAMVSHYTTKALKQAYTLAKTLLVLAVVYGLYQLMTQLLFGVIEAAIRGIVSKLTERGSISDRVANAIGIAIAALAAYAVYRVAVWSIQPLLDKFDVPDPEQTSMSEYASNQTPDVPEGSMAEDILNDDD